MATEFSYDLFHISKRRVLKGEISASTISNYYTPLKFFWNMNDIDV